jgi:hypothetical protein
MSLLWFESTILVFERVKTFRALARAVNVIGTSKCLEQICKSLITEGNYAFLFNIAISIKSKLRLSDITLRVLTVHYVFYKC